jgi:hypothetical protein
MQCGAANSRRLLVHTIKALKEFKEAVTVIGAHAVHIWVEQAWGPTGMEATRDGDIVLNPVFVAADPKLIDVMAGVGITPALEDRPGIYGFADEADMEWRQRTTVDLIVPEAYAGPGRRAARILGQRHATSRAVGLELALWDRTLAALTTLDDPTESVEAYVAGPAALLTAKVHKVHKVHERLADAQTRPARLKAKDSGDVALLMMVSDPAQVAQVMVEAVVEHPEISDVVTKAAMWLTELYGDIETLTHHHALDALSARFGDSEVAEAMDSWLAVFRPAVSALTIASALPHE